MTTVRDIENGPATLDGASAASPRPRFPLLWRLFATNAIVLSAVALLLLVSPITISAPIALAEAIIVLAGLIVALFTDLMLLRRTLEPLRRFTTVIRSIDPMRPGLRLPPDRSYDADVIALADAFNTMLDRLESERRNSARNALLAQEEERLRIARELHDQVGQTLTAVTIQTERALDQPPDEAARALPQIAAATRESLDDVRRIARQLRPEALDDLGLINALIALCNRISVQSGVRVERRLEGGPSVRDAQAELAIYRVAQEALTNAVRHAGASVIEVSLAERDAAIELRVRDDGTGWSGAESPTGSGLRGMRERAMLEGASLEIDSERGRGTEIVLNLPLND